MKRSLQEVTLRFQVYTTPVQAIRAGMATITGFDPKSDEQFLNAAMREQFGECEIQAHPIGTGSFRRIE